MDIVASNHKSLFNRAKRWYDLHNTFGYCISAPEIIVLGVNNVCNLHCVMCDVGTGSSETNFARSLIGTKPINMPFDLLKRVIDNSSTFSPKPEIGFAFTEPGIYPDLVQGVEYAKQFGMYVSVTTSGTTLQRLAEGLAEAGLDALHVSLDGPPEVHDRIRGKKGSYEAARIGIETLYSIRPTFIDIFFAVTNENYGSIVAFADSLSDWHIASVTVMHTNFVTQELAQHHNQYYGNRYRATVSSMAGFNPCNVDINILADELEQVTATSRYPFPVHIQPRLITKEALNMYYKNHAQPIGRRCVDPFKYLMVKSNGDVIAAHGRCYDVKVGNVYECSLQTIWNSVQFRTFRRTLLKAGGLLPACTRCCGGFSN